MTVKPPNMTTDAGISVASDKYSLTVGPADPNLLRALARSRSATRAAARFGRDHIGSSAHSHGEAVQRARAIGLLTGPSADPRTSVGPTAAYT
jgi:hypothetical protein